MSRVFVVRRMGRLVASIAFAAGVGGCSGALEEGEFEPIAEADEALNGTIVWGDFSKPECAAVETTFKQKIQEAYRSWVVPYVVNDPSVLTRCLKEAILSGETWDGANGRHYDITYPEYAMMRLRDAVPTKIGCDTGLTGCQFRGSAGSEEYVCRPEYANATVGENAYMAVHEIAHRYYDHPFDASQILEEANATVNQNLAQCMNQLTLGNLPPMPEAPARSTLKQEASLAQVGNESGTIQRISACAGSTFVTGFHGKTSSKVDSLGYVCRAKGGTTTVTLPALGGTGGTAFSTACPANMLAVGAKGRADGSLNALGFVCRLESDIHAGIENGTEFRAPQRGGLAGVSWERTCPRFMALKAMNVRTSSGVDRVEFICQDLRSPSRIDQSILGGTTAAPGYTSYLESCQSEGLLTKLHTRSGTSLDRIGGHCQSVMHFGADQTHNTVWLAGSGDHVLASHGGSGGTSDVSTCPPSQGIVGLQLYLEADKVAGVAAKCADVRLWSSGSNPPVTTLPTRGRTTSVIGNHNCPPGRLATGLLTRSSQTVHGVQLICREFGD